MDGLDIDDATAVLRRGPVLAACRDESTTRREIADRTGVSRTTAYRATTDLVEQGLLTTANGGYRTTPRGRALLAASEAFGASIETIESLDALFDLVDHPELVDHAHLLRDAEVVVADASNPYRVVERSVERLAETTTSVGTLANPAAAEAIRQSEPLVPETDRFERILSEAALETNATIGGEAFDAATAEESVELLVAPTEAVPFSFAIDDDDVSVVGHDPTTGLPTVHVESTDPAARKWLTGLYEECRERARPVGAD